MNSRNVRLWLGIAFATLLMAGFLILSSEVREASWGHPELIGTIDSIAVSMVNDVRNPTLNGIAIDLTALGSATIITFFVVATAVLMVFRRRYTQVVHLIVAAVGSTVFTSILKSYFERPRPSGLARLVDVQGYSYPSGHSLSSAAVYFTFAILFCQKLQKPIERTFILGIALLIIFLIALSRVYLGVHYLSDVIAGAMVGISWAATLAAIAAYLEIRRKR